MRLLTALYISFSLFVTSCRASKTFSKEVMCNSCLYITDPEMQEICNDMTVEHFCNHPSELKSYKYLVQTDEFHPEIQTKYMDKIMCHRKFHNMFKDSSHVLRYVVDQYISNNCNIRHDAISLFHSNDETHRMLVDNSEYIESPAEGPSYDELSVEPPESQWIVEPPPPPLVSIDSPTDAPMSDPPTSSFPLYVQFDISFDMAYICQTVSSYERENIMTTILDNSFPTHVTSSWFYCAAPMMRRRLQGTDTSVRIDVRSYVSDITEANSAINDIVIQQRSGDLAKDVETVVEANMNDAKVTNVSFTYPTVYASNGSRIDTGTLLISPVSDKTNDIRIGVGVGIGVGVSIVISIIGSTYAIRRIKSINAMKKKIESGATPQEPKIGVFHEPPRPLDIIDENKPSAQYPSF